MLIEPKYVLAKLEDSSEILKMMKDFYAIDGYPFDEKTMQTSMQAFLSNDTLGFIYLIKNNEKTAGYVCLCYGFSFEYDGKIAVLDELFINATYRNQGLGKKTLEFLDSKANEYQIKAIHMEVESHNLAALGLYTSQGFKTKGRKLYSKLFD
jgi:ribosomal protein S18 acetylase RimI-like enzyme